MAIKGTLIVSLITVVTLTSITIGTFGYHVSNEPIEVENFPLKVEFVKEEPRSKYVFADIDRGFFSALLSIIAIGTMLGVMYYHGKINRKLFHKIYAIASVLLIIPTVLLPCFAHLIAGQQYDRGAEEYNKAIDYVRYARDEIILGDYEDAITWINTALTHLYKAKRFFKEAQDLGYYLTDSRYREISNALEITEKNIDNCYLLKGYIYQLIEEERKGKAIADLMDMILSIMGVILDIIS
ncbi:MAG: hypothetical protein DRJ38_09760 [Thermoprotei archaeon]|nr:MAG: hypothetical protein DRJ38_09760 [Thermoprotei archaeon]